MAEYVGSVEWALNEALRTIPRVTGEELVAFVNANCTPHARMTAMGMRPWSIPDGIYEQMWNDQQERVQRWPDLWAEAR